MSTHEAQVAWNREGQELDDGTHRTGHVWRLDGGAEIPASASPSVVGKRRSYADRVDPEEAFVAAASSCHMLFFLHFAHDRGFPVARYDDKAVGHMEKTPDGKIWITRIDLHPKIDYVGAAPDAETVRQLHHDAHEACFIANSAKTDIRVVEGSWSGHEA